MVRRTGLKPAVLATALFFLAVWLGFVIGRPREPDLGVDPKDAFVLLEETTFVVPQGTRALFTALGSRFGSTTPAGQGIEIVGSLVQGDDDFALGYLRPQPGSAGDSAIPPAGLNRTASN